MSARVTDNGPTIVRNKFKSAGYPMRFVNSVIHELTIAQTNEGIEFVILSWLFEVKKKIVLVKIIYCFENENSTKQCIKKVCKIYKRYA